MIPRHHSGRIALLLARVIEGSKLSIPDANNPYPASGCRDFQISGGVESKKPAMAEAAKTRDTDEMRLFDSSGKIGGAARSAGMRGTRMWWL